MTNYFYQAKLIKLNEIEIFISPHLSFYRNSLPLFFITNEERFLLKEYQLVEKPEATIIILSLPIKYPFGEKCYVECEILGRIPVNVENAISFKEFDELFSYDGDDLGASYSKEETTFKLWSPLSEEVTLVLENEDGSFSYHQMIRKEKGVYSYIARGDYLNRRYRYIIYVNNIKRVTFDPYAKMLDVDSEYGVVVDFSLLEKMPRIEPKRVMKSFSDASIYELHVTDFTSHKKNTVKNKGKFLGLIEEGLKSPEGHPISLDYLKYLGVSHIQLLPVIDYQGKNIIDYNKDYNWGYDPISMFALEGRYSNNVSDYQNRLYEFRKMVDTMHQNDIRVNLDIVYNHIFEHLSSCFESVVPGYYFRTTKDSTFSNASGCGNDIASERKMVRKMILDSAKYLFKTFDIDGLRLDLMGLLDLKTIEEIENFAHEYKKDSMIYGEGWDMGEELPREKKASYVNASKIQQVGFFNDVFRDIVKGGTMGSDIARKGFASGDFSYYHGFIYAFLGSAVNRSYNRRFEKAHQSINYVECHDNHTIFDKLSISNRDENEETILKRIMLMNGLTILSFGVPFIHMGQEIGLSKHGLGNTYNVPKVNNFDIDLYDKRFDMSAYLKSILKIRNEELSFFNEINDPKVIEDITSFKIINDSLLAIKIDTKKINYPYGEILIIINVLNNNSFIELDDYYNPIFIYSGVAKSFDEMSLKNIIISPLSITILKK